MEMEPRREVERSCYNQLPIFHEKQKRKRR
jgi:hypothetical protein